MKKSEITEKLILEEGVKLWPNVSAREIARRIGITHAAISYYFKADLKDAIAEYAVLKGKSRVIAQLIATKHKAVRGLTVVERIKHLHAITD